MKTSVVERAVSMSSPSLSLYPVLRLISPNVAGIWRRDRTGIMGTRDHCCYFIISSTDGLPTSMLE